MPKPRTRHNAYVRSNSVQRAAVTPPDQEPRKPGPKRKPRPLPSIEDMKAAWEAAAHTKRVTAGDLRSESPNGQCRLCERPVTGERRLCGPCSARRSA